MLHALGIMFKLKLEIDMDINRQVLSIEQMNHLKELSVDTSKASMAWCASAYDEYDKMELEIHADVIDQCRNKLYWHIEPTFTLQDMLEMMPKVIIDNEECECNLYIFFHEDGISIYYEDDYSEQPAFFCESSVLESAYNMLCWLAENNYLNKK